MCIFCKIANGEIPSEFVYQDEKMVAIRDIAPTAPVHLLLIPKQHLTDVMELDAEMAAHIFTIVPQIAKLVGVDEQGFRLVINTGKNGGQTVPHLHIHLLGGRELGWPAG